MSPFRAIFISVTSAALRKQGAAGEFGHTMIAWGIVILGMLAAMLVCGSLIVIAFLTGCVFAGCFTYSKSWTAGRKILIAVLLASLPLAIATLFIINGLARVLE